MPSPVGLPTGKRRYKGRCRRAPTRGWPQTDTGRAPGDLTRGLQRRQWPRAPGTVRCSALTWPLSDRRQARRTVRAMEASPSSASALPSPRAWFFPGAFPEVCSRRGATLASLGPLLCSCPVARLLPALFRLGGAMRLRPPDALGFPAAHHLLAPCPPGGRLCSRGRCPCPSACSARTSGPTSPRASDTDGTWSALRMLRSVPGRCSPRIGRRRTPRSRRGLAPRPACLAGRGGLVAVESLHEDRRPVRPSRRVAWRLAVAAPCTHPPEPSVGG